MTVYRFDVRLFAAIDVEAGNPEEAKSKLWAALDDARTINMGAWPDDSPILGDGAIDTADDGPDAQLYSIDGNEVS